MNKLYFLPLVLAAFLTGCDTPEKAQERMNNTAYFASHPQLIATNTAKGNLYRFQVDIGRGSQNHWVYYFDNSTNTITINNVEPVGKSSYNKVVVIDGVEYIKRDK